MSAIAVKGADFKITVVVGAAFIAQSALALLWTGAAAERLAQLERSADRSGEMLERAARMEEQIAGVKASLARIETKIDGGAQ